MDYAASAMDGARGADACVLVTEWAEFLDLDWAQVKTVDGPADRHRRPQCPGWRRAAEMGFTYEGVGTRSQDCLKGRHWLLLQMVA